MIEPGTFPPERPFPSAKKRALQELLIEQAEASQQHRRRSRRHIRVTVISVATVGVLGGGGAIAYSAISSNSVTDKSMARCYTAADYRSGADFPGTSIAAADSASGAPGAVHSAIDVCAALWRAGYLQWGATEPDRSPSRSVYPVPALVECVMPNGQGAVFPGTAATCQKFGLTIAATRPAS